VRADRETNGQTTKGKIRKLVTISVFALYLHIGATKLNFTYKKTYRYLTVNLECFHCIQLA